MKARSNSSWSAMVSSSVLVLLLLCFVDEVISADTTTPAPEETSAPSEPASGASGETAAATDEATQAPPASETPPSVATGTSEATVPPAPPASTSNIYGLDDKCSTPSVVIPPFMHCVEVGCVERQPCQTPQLRDSYCCPHVFGVETVTCCLFAGGTNSNQGQANGGPYPNGYEPYPRPNPGNYQPQPPYGYPGRNFVYSWG